MVIVAQQKLAQTNKQTNKNKNLDEKTKSVFKQLFSPKAQRGVALPKSSPSNPPSMNTYFGFHLLQGKKD